MKKVIVFAILSALSILFLSAGDAEACLVDRGKHVGTAKVSYKKTKRKNIYSFSYKIEWKPGVTAKFQGIRLHRYLRVKRKGQAKLLIVKAGEEKSSPKHFVLASPRTDGQITFEVFTSRRYSRYFDNTFSHTFYVYQKPGKKGASFGLPYGPDDFIPKGGCGIPDPKWPGTKGNSPPAPTTKDF